MQEKDKILISTVKDIAVEAAIDYVGKQFPAIEIAFKLANGYYGSNIKLRKKRALEFIEIINNNPGVFAKEIVNTEEFQDGFVYILEKYLSERNQEKRRIIGNIFLGFTVSEEKSKFKVERFINVLQQLDLDSVELFEIFYDGSVKEWLIAQKVFKDEDIDKEARRPVNLYQIGRGIMPEIKGKKNYEDQEFLLEKINPLVNLDLLIQSVDSMGVVNSSYRASEFGKEFYKFLTQV